jgi:hypothetical protein
MPLSEARASDGRGHWTYEYASLLDPASFDRNFSTVSETPYLSYVRFDVNRPSSVTLLRRRIKLQFGE